ncbi:unnamed protein product [Phytomonas sp. EM1]|nr:unnamed protein product [Phytomonas sp. EM1]|eukprot:CCW65259.1 unnamed protein product [Phytomonas sp. isolate EM1]
MRPDVNAHFIIDEAVRLGELPSEENLSRLRKMTPLDLCKEMKSYLCNEDTSGVAMQVLAQATMQRNHLHDEELCAIVNFLCEKATKPKFTATALSSLRSIVDDLSQECSMVLFSTLINSLIKEMPLQNLRLSVRRDGFAIICFMINKNTIESCKAGYLRALLEFMDGEADPVLVNDFFQLCKRILMYANQEELQSVVQSYFDSLSAYFPVVFTPPQKCPITKRDLQRGLLACLSDQVLVDNSIPFFINKLSSPSMVVRHESIEALETIIETGSAHVGTKHLLDMVLHTRNEIIRVCFYPQYDDNSSTKSFISLCFGLLKSVSKKCGKDTALPALEVFSPISEGVISSINSEPTLCSVYGTMLYHILTGSFSCSMVCGAHLLTVLCAEEDKDHLSSVCLLLSAVCSGLADALRAFAHNNNTEADGLRNRIGQPILERLLDLVRYCGHQIIANSITDEFSTSCIVEFLASFFRLSKELTPCFGKGDAELGLHALLHTSVSLASSHVASSKAISLICNIASPDADDVIKVIREKLINNTTLGVSADRMLSLLERVACISMQHALFVINECFFGPTIPVHSWQTELTEVQRSSAVLHILDNINSIDDNTAIDLLKKLTTNEGRSWYYFKCIFSLFSRTSEAFHETVRKNLDQLPLVVAAVLACSSTPTPCSDSYEKTKCLLHQFDELVRSSQSLMVKMVSMNGISGVVSTSTLKYDELSKFLSAPLAGVAVHIATLWGICFRPSSSENSDSTTATITSSLGNLLLVANENEVLDALSFLPIQFTAEMSRKRQNLLSCYVSINVDSVVSLRVYWKGISCLLKVESIKTQPVSEAHFIERLHQGCRVGVATELLRQALCAFIKNQSSATLVIKELLLNPTLLEFVLEGLRSERLVDRCEALGLLSSFSALAVNIVNEQHSESNLFRKARDIILNVTQISLSDKKRKVRRAAAHCQHVWYNLN